MSEDTWSRQGTGRNGNGKGQGQGQGRNNEGRRAERVIHVETVDEARNPSSGLQLWDQWDLPEVERKEGSEASPELSGRGKDMLKVTILEADGEKSNVRLEKNRNRNVEWRRKKKQWIDDLQRSVIVLSEANRVLKQNNEELMVMLQRAEAEVAAIEQPNNDKTSAPVPAAPIQRVEEQVAAIAPAAPVQRIEAQGVAIEQANNDMTTTNTTPVPAAPVAAILAKTIVIDSKAKDVINSNSTSRRNIVTPTPRKGSEVSVKPRKRYIVTPTPRSGPGKPRKPPRGKRRRPSDAEDADGCWDEGKPP